MSATKILSYREESDSDDSNPRPVTLRPRQRPGQSDVQPSSSVKTPTKKLPPKVTRSSSIRQKRTLFSHSHRAVADDSPTKKRRLTQAPVVEPANIGNIPPWHTLPFEALVDIFFQAAPISVGKPTVEFTKETKWLVGVSRLCRAFVEPALSVLYHSPPLNSHGKLQALVSLLERDPSSLYLEYARKVHALDISSALPQNRYLDLLRLVSRLPALKYLRIYDSTEYGQPRRTFSNLVLHDLVSRIDSNGCRLQFFEWNKRQVPLSIETFHLRPCFEHLQSLRLYNLEFEDFSDEGNAEDDNQSRTFGEEMAVAMSRLKYLRELDFTNCEIPGCAFLLSLPDCLESLRFSRCDNLASENLERFLLTHGRNLRSLNMTNNRELSMAFTVKLGESCPKLEVFKMDLNFSSPTLFAYDVEPHFDALLSKQQIPDWPTSLQVLHLERLRKWDGETAKRFFDNLVESAPRLPNLRTLIITAIVDVNWRDRASLRKAYGQALERIFLRRTSDGLSSKIESSTAHDTERPPPPLVMARRSNRIARKVADPDELGEDISEPSEAATPKGSGSGTFVHGLCDTVVVRIDNLRPADVLLTADNFQDDEPSDDEEWNGEDVDFNDGYAW